MKLAKLLVISIGAVFLVPRVSSAAESWLDLLRRADSLAMAQVADSAISVGKLALEKTQTEFGGEDTSSALVLSHLAWYAYLTADYAGAELLSRRALAIKEKVFGPEDSSVGEALNNLGILFYDRGKYAEAETFHRRALAIREKALGPEHPDVAASLNNLGILCDDQGKYAEAETLYRRALVIWERAMGPEHQNVAYALNSLAIVYDQQGKYAEAEPLYKRALSIREKELGPNDPLVALTLNNLGILYQALGKYTEADPVYKRALAICESAFGPEHPKVGECLANLAALYLDEDRYADAEPLFQRVGTIWEKAFGPSHPALARSQMNLARLYQYQGRFNAAESLYHQALMIQEKVLGPEHPDVASCLGSLGNLYCSQGRYGEAEPLYARELTIVEKSLGPAHPKAADTRELISGYDRAIGRLDLGMAEAEKVFRVRLENFRDNVYVLSEKDALQYARKLRRSMGYYLSTCTDVGSVDSEQAERIVVIALAAKGQVSDEIFSRHKALVTETDSTTKKLAGSWRASRFKLSRLFVSGPGDDTTTAYRHELDSLSSAANNLEAQLARHSASFRRRQELNSVNVERIIAVLPANVSFIEYLKWDYVQIKPDSLIPRYTALVISKKEQPALVNLGDASAIEPLIGSYLKHMQRLASAGRQPNAADLAEYQPISQAIYEKIWQPLEKHFKKNQTIFVGLDGSLNLVSLAGLMDEKGKYLTEKYVIHHLSSGRDLIRLKENPESGHGLFALGDPDFDASIASRMTKSSEPLLMASATTDGEYQTRNVRSGCGSLSDLQVENLPFTRKEVEGVSHLWQGKGLDSAEVLVGAQATEDVFKAEAPGKRVLHLATHGYYLTGQCAPQIAARQSFSSERGFVGENPLLQSGLLLAGSNLHGAGCDSAHCEDGILSASEVAGMDLTGNDLVVLSACETGLGEVKSGEGVYGLRRAFQMAGARTVISSLWPVPDQATSEVMSQLYGKSKKSLPERLRDLQLAQIKKLRDSGAPDHPYSWGAFIALGDWR